DEFLEQAAIANPHVTLHFIDPDGQETVWSRSTEQLPPEAKEIKPHPYGVEMGMLITMLKDTKFPNLTQFLTNSFSRVSPGIAKKICETAGLSTRSNTKKIGRNEAEKLYNSIKETKITNPATDCISPIGEELLLKGLHKVVPGEFYTAATRPPAVYRGNPFVIEVALAYGGGPATHKVSLEALTELLGQSDARTLRQFIMNTFAGLGADAADKILKNADIGVRVSPSRIKGDDIAKLHDAMQNVSTDDGQTMNVLRYANRVPLQFQPGACAITQMIMGTNWKAYGLSQSRNSLPSGPVTIMVHMASVWVPFTSESKEAIASYPEIQKELRLALQAVGRRLAMYVRRRQKVKQEGERRNIFLRYLGEVATAVSSINSTDADTLYDRLLAVAKSKTAEADVRLDENGKPILEEDEDLDFGQHVLIVGRDGPEEATPADGEPVLEQGREQDNGSPGPRPKKRRSRGK
ncbi:MAG: DNA topoisomerase VI subunit B, partial [Pirellulales bacterium]